MAEPSFDLLGDSAAVALRPMRDTDEDYRLMSKWLTDERVLEWYEGRSEPYPYERVVQKFAPRILAEEAVIPCFMLHRGTPVGYLQYYAVADPADYELETAEGAWAFDLFIGEPGLWSQGIGTSALRLILAHVFEKCGATRGIIDPRVVNERAIRAYEKVGFKKVKVLKDHERHEGELCDNWLMEIAKPG